MTKRLKKTGVDEMTHVIQCPEEYNGNVTSVFLAGGITDCPDWQTKMAELLRDSGLVLFNPRRENFPIDDPNASEFQINWEFKHLAKANGILFWFPKETLCPITLYELGKWTMSDKPVFIGIHPEYERKVDVEIQTKLQRQDIPIVYSLEELAKEVIKGMK